jgi:plastocyanin
LTCQRSGATDACAAVWIGLGRFSGRCSSCHKKRQHSNLLFVYALSSIRFSRKLAQSTSSLILSVPPTNNLFNLLDMHCASLLSIAAFSAAAQAASFTVKVGQGGNVFEPSTITAQVGDQVVFQWGGSAHSVVQSTFDDPCSPLAGGFEVPTQSSSDATFTIDVTSTDPQWFYCAVCSFPYMRR